jgi:hypothetical protein
VSPRTARLVVWLTAALALPVPLLVLGPGEVPALRIAMLGALSLLFCLAESARGAAGLAAAILLGQAALYLTGFWLAARLALLPLARSSRAARAAVTLACVALALAASVRLDLYRDSFHPRLASSGLLEAYE